MKQLIEWFLSCFTIRKQEHSWVTVDTNVVPRMNKCYRCDTEIVRCIESNRFYIVFEHIEGDNVLSRDADMLIRITPKQFDQVKLVTV